MERTNPRSAGILMHITSLPTPFGIGDMGPSALAFADMLQQAGQRYWQLLPLNFIAPGDHSPYSAVSAMAGNIMLISPELLAAEGLLDKKALGKATLPVAAVDFKAALALKLRLLEQAYGKFREGGFNALREAFMHYCSEQAWWLDDFTAYRAWSARHPGKSWPGWDTRPQNRDAGFESARQQEQWYQFLFDRQLAALRAHCKERGMQLIGDLPFYVSYHAADVWANRELCKLDGQGRMQGIAGVPPDYFNEKGQLWNMPVYNWEAMKARQYDWWMHRIRRSMQWYDLLRLDHFRAFAGYWEVPAGSADAINGSWQPGPGAPLLERFREEFPGMPFIAEDLGDIDDTVYALRDRFHLPGMRVLQFAFGNDMPSSLHIPHHYVPHAVAYTGTHDNNTSRGWFTEEAGDKGKRQLALYTGRSVNGKHAAVTLSRLCYASVANTAILPMQDVLNLGSDARMNRPAVTDGSWQWRMQPGAFGRRQADLLREWVTVYNRAPL